MSLPKINNQSMFAMLIIITLIAIWDILLELLIETRLYSVVVIQAPTREMATPDVAEKGGKELATIVDNNVTSVKLKRPRSPLPM
jgi:hypothetical protein